MPGLSYDIDKLLREIQGVGQHQDAADQLRPASNLTATSSSNYTAMPPSVHAIRGRGSSNLHQLRHPTNDIEDCEIPLDAFGDHLLLPRHARGLIINTTDQALLNEPEEGTRSLNSPSRRGQTTAVPRHERGSYLLHDLKEQLQVERRRDSKELTTHSGRSVWLTTYSFNARHPELAPSP